MLIRTTLTSVAALMGFAGLSMAEVPAVATDIAPVHGLVSRVMQGIGEPDLVVPAGASPHDHSMRPSEAMALAQADVVFWMGEALTPWLEGAMVELARDAKTVELLDLKGSLVLPFREGVEFEAHDHDEDAHEEHDHDSETHAEEHDDHHEGEHAEDHHDAHDHEGADPHAWLSPENAVLWLDVIAAELSVLDAENAAQYVRNAAAGKAEIQEAKAQILASLEAVGEGSFVVFHDAYQYFEHSFGVQAAGAIALSDASDPSPARIAEIQHVVAEKQVSCVFSEPQFNPDLVATVLEGSAAKTVVIDPMGTGLALGPNFYPALLQELGAAMAGCR